MSKSIYNNILASSQNNEKLFTLLIDPDNESTSSLEGLMKSANDNCVDYLYVGGSLFTQDCLNSCLDVIKKNSNIPVVLFPGSTLQISDLADAILFLSVISGRNAEMLIGQHVITAPLLKQSSLEVIPTGYMLIESGQPTAVSYMSNTTPIPHNKKSIAASTAMAGEMLGLKTIFMDGGSGAQQPISEEMISAVKSNISIPLIIGGGIASAEKAIANYNAGADMIVVGNAIEKDPGLIHEICAGVKQ